MFVCVYVKFHQVISDLLEVFKRNENQNWFAFAILCTAFLGGLSYSYKPSSLLKSAKTEVKSEIYRPSMLCTSIFGSRK